MLAGISTYFFWWGGGKSLCSIFIKAILGCRHLQCTSHCYSHSSSCECYCVSLQTPWISRMPIHTLIIWVYYFPLPSISSSLLHLYHCRTPDRYKCGLHTDIHYQTTKNKHQNFCRVKQEILWIWQGSSNNICFNLWPQLCLPLLMLVTMTITPFKGCNIERQHSTFQWKRMLIPLTFNIKQVKKESSNSCKTWWTRELTTTKI